MKNFIDKYATPMSIGLSIFALLIGFLFPRLLPFDASWIAVVFCGLPIIKDAVIGLVTEFDIKADVLVSIALIASIIIGEVFAAAEISVIMTIGAYLEELTVNRAQAGIAKLIDLSPLTARKVFDGKEEIVKLSQVQKADVLRVIAGETVPLDGKLTAGQTTIDQSLLTGESVPVEKVVGDSVYSGTMNQYGTFEMIVEKEEKDSSLQRMIQLVESADTESTPIVRTADKWATWIVVASLSTAIVTWLVTKDILRSVTILVVFCPCALVLATPTAIIAAIGNATKHGILIKSGEGLEKLASVERVTLDKTGTITYGKPEVVDCLVFTEKYFEKELLGLATIVEYHSEHPLGRAIVAAADVSQTNLDELRDLQVVPGKGIMGNYKDSTIKIGTDKIVETDRSNSDFDNQLRNWNSSHFTVVYMEENGELIGAIALTDTLREEAAEMIRAIQQQNTQPLLLTGDNEHIAQNIASQVGISEVHAECLPEDKLKVIRNLQNNCFRVAMIGDGINDAPALKLADVGIAMGGAGSDIAIDAADVVLMQDDLKELPYLLSLSKKTMKTIQVNILLAMGINFVAVVLASMGLIGPIMGALVHNIGSVAVIIHSAMLLKYSIKKTTNTESVVEYS